MTRYPNKNVVSGALITLLGLFFVAYSLANYRMGTLQQMGPGMFPTIMGSVLLALGVLNLFQGIRQPAANGVPFDVRSFASIIGGIVLFSVTVPLIGLIPAVMIMLLPVTFAESRLRPVETLAIVLVMAVVVYVVFHLLLHMPLRFFRWPF